ncbi:PIN domain-containing protein [Aetokthonos hydrillicola Thurmond2011]|uniref:PIN domain-containing protein n=1 Tax=Aetokthonos hydrillicola Thurmond2011 TaxID=2712845 RepID=A0AAP5I7U3_9CYAN|nr:PIN domain-containing protein [Aetokthonos hydrillicola]MBO3460040.1 type II toxin-antitoxin system VapC family toxin [Aetokthonos hydrillicola CCALA 1050]MBW4584637.1 PIN domain-containing protein [Aetokthonos hydrillicola CCALA 1050]MDR9895182.1 PIN domain-containing protein [Aetokthonos hydrillicola Thurmond2011]
MVKALFDTSVLIAALWTNHPKHSGCTALVKKVKLGNLQGIICTHTLAELYSVLTRLPIKPPVSPKLAQQLINENLAEFEVISLSAQDYESVINKMVTLNLTGGAIYDALIAQIILKTEIDQLLTLNPNHFIRLGEEIAKLVEVPT